MVRNVAETGHPYHHLTRNSAIVDGDPRAHVQHEEYLWEAGITLAVPTPWRRPKKAVPRVDGWYDTKAGKAWLKVNSSAQEVQAMPVQHSLW